MSHPPSREKSHLTIVVGDCGHVYIYTKRSWPPGNSRLVQGWTPHQSSANQVLPPGDLEWGMGVAGQLGSKSWEIILFHGKGAHCSLCKWKQRKLERERKMEQKHTAIGYPMRIVIRMRDRASWALPDGFLIPDSCSSGDKTLPFPLKSETAGCTYKIFTFFPLKLIWKDFRYFHKNKIKWQKIKNKRQTNREGWGRLSCQSKRNHWIHKEKKLCSYGKPSKRNGYKEIWKEKIQRDKLLLGEQGWFHTWGQLLAGVEGRAGKRSDRGGEEGILLEQVKNSQTFDEPVGWRFGFKSEGATHAMMILSPQ